MRDSEDRPVLLVELHPAAPPIEIWLRGSGRIQATAITTPAGPGYHQYLCDLFRQLADDFGWLEEHCRKVPDQAAQAYLEVIAREPDAVRRALTARATEAA